MKKILAVFVIPFLLLGTLHAGAEYDMPADTQEVDEAIWEEDTVFSPANLTVEAPSCILIEASTGTVLYEKEADARLEPASVTKVMTILLIAEAIDSGTLSLDETVTVSTYAASMGGSQIFLKEGEVMSVQELLKSIIVASANDAAVAMAEHLCGSEMAFVAQMNQRAQELGMQNTRFCNCTGLLENPDHLTTARDIALMSAELLRHTWITQYTTIWTDTVRNGEFGLSNTNKLIRFYDGATGLKTGFTSSAGYCLSASAQRDGIQYIAVVMNCPSSAVRFESAKALLSYAFANYSLYVAQPEQALGWIPVTLGRARSVPVATDRDAVLVVDKTALGTITTQLELESSVKAPVYTGQKVGSFTVRNGDEILFTTPIVADADVAKLGIRDIFLQILRSAFVAG